MATKHTDKCLQKAADDEPIFVLLGRDVSSPKTICYWILDNIETLKPEKAHEALEHALNMRKYPNRKFPD